MEIWKSISGYEDMYEISSYGRVRRSGRILKNRMDSNGYLSVMLCKSGKPRRYRVHRLVAEAFIQNPENKYCVNHKDGNRSNPNINNLEWLTINENHKHAYDFLGRAAPYSMLGKLGREHNRSKGFWIRYEDGREEYFGSGLEFARKTGLDHTSISYARKNGFPYKFRKGGLKGMTVFEINEPIT